MICLKKSLTLKFLLSFICLSSSVYGYELVVGDEGAVEGQTFSFPVGENEINKGGEFFYVAAHESNTKGSGDVKEFTLSRVRRDRFFSQEFPNGVPKFEPLVPKFVKIVGQSGQTNPLYDTGIIFFSLLENRRDRMIDSFPVLVTSDRPKEIYVLDLSNYRDSLYEKKDEEGLCDKKSSKISVIPFTEIADAQGNLIDKIEGITSGSPANIFAAVSPQGGFGEDGTGIAMFKWITIHENKKKDVKEIKTEKKSQTTEKKSKTEDKKSEENDRRGVMLRPDKKSWALFHEYCENEKIDELALSGDKKYLVSYSSKKNNTIKIWNLQKEVPTPTATILLEENDYIETLEINPRGTHVAAGFEDGNLKIYSLNGELVHTFTQLQGDRVHSISFHPDGRHIVACNDGERNIKIWDLSTGQVVSNLQATHDAEHRIVKCSPDGRHFITVCVAESEPTKISIWEIKNKRGEITGQFIKTLDQEIKNGDPHTVAFSQDGRHIALGSAPEEGVFYEEEEAAEIGKITVFAIKNDQDEITGDVVATLKGHKDGAVALAFIHEEKGEDLEERISYLHKQLVEERVAPIKIKLLGKKKLIAPKPFL